MITKNEFWFMAYAQVFAMQCHPRHVDLTVGMDDALSERLSNAACNAALCADLALDMYDQKAEAVAAARVAPSVT